MLRHKIVTWKALRQPQRHLIYWLQITIGCRSRYPFQLPFHIYIPLDFHRFTIKSLGQFHTLQSLQLWARIALPANQSIGSHYLHHHLCKCLKLLRIPNQSTTDNQSITTTSRSHHAADDLNQTTVTRTRRPSPTLDIKRTIDLRRRRPYLTDDRIKSRARNVENKDSPRR